VLNQLASSRITYVVCVGGELVSICFASTATGAIASSILKIQKNNPKLTKEKPLTNIPYSFSFMFCNIRIPIARVLHFKSFTAKQVSSFRTQTKIIKMEQVPEDSLVARSKFRSIQVGDGIHTDIYERVTENKSHNIKIVIVPGKTACS
jgi:hypothetical protein